MLKDNSFEDGQPKEEFELKDILEGNVDEIISFMKKKIEKISLPQVKIFLNSK